MAQRCFTVCSYARISNFSKYNSFETKSTLAVFPGGIFTPFMARVVYHLLVSLVIGMLIAACAPSHAGRTVGRGVLQAEGSLGGPMVTNLGGAIPVPNIPVGARYGLTDRLDVAGHVNLLPIIMGGFLVLDASLTFGILKQEGKRGVNLATSSGVAFLSDFQTGARVSPVVDMAVSYTVSRFTPFVGCEFIADMWQSRAITDPFVGLEVDVGRWSVSAAVVWFHPAHDWYASSIRYFPETHQGALGFLVGLKRRWHTRRSETK